MRTQNPVVGGSYRVVVGLNLCCCHLEIFSCFLNKDPRLSFCPKPPSADNSRTRYPDLSSFPLSQCSMALWIMERSPWWFQSCFSDMSLLPLPHLCPHEMFSSNWRYSISYFILFASQGFEEKDH